MVRTQRHSPFNVVLVLRFARGPAPGAMARALAALGARHGLLASRVGEHAGRPAFVPGAAPLALERLQWRGEEGWRALAETALARPFDLAAGPLCHALLVGPEANGRADLVLAFPHVVVDASSGAALVEELVALAAGGPRVAGAAADLPPLDERFPPRHRGLAGRARVVRALLRELAGEARFALALSRRRLPRLAVAPTGGSRIATWELSGVETTALLAGLRRRRLTLNGTLAACWTAALAASRYGGRGGPVRVFTMAGLRRLVRPPVADHALGAGWAMVRTTCEVPAAPVDPAAFAGRTCRQLHAGLARGDAFTSYATADPMMRLVLGPLKQRMGELAVSYTGVAPVAARHGPLQLADLHVFVSTMDIGPALVVHHCTWEGRLLGGLVYHDHDLDAARVAAMGEEVRRSLRVLAAPAPGSEVPGAATGGEAGGAP